LWGKMSLTHKKSAKSPISYGIGCE
jgi:hypothetical protein